MLNLLLPTEPFIPCLSHSPMIVIHLGAFNRLYSHSRQYLSVIWAMAKALIGEKGGTGY